jgi:hypothetical protein
MSYDGVRIHVSDGKSYEVRHPDMVFVTTRVVHIAMPPMDDDVPAGRTAYVDPLHITRVEPLNGNHSKPKKRTKS